MTATNEAALRDAIDRIAIDYANEDYESCLRRCSSLLFDDERSLTQRVKASLYVFMRDCCAFLLRARRASVFGPADLLVLRQVAARRAARRRTVGFHL